MSIDLFSKEHTAIKILSLDLGKFKSVSCLYQGDSAEFQTVATDRELFRQPIVKASADVVVFETCTVAGWLADLCEELNAPFLVANPNGEAWRWSRIKRKTDRDDALKLARITAMNELPSACVVTQCPCEAKLCALSLRRKNAPGETHTMT